jgi:hypothetical protein
VEPAGEIATILNRQEIVVGNRQTGFAPEDLNSENSNLFLEALYKAAPNYRSPQFAIDPRHTVFKFSDGDYVRAKLIVTSSAVLGEKRSETNLTDSVFKIAKSYPVVTRTSRLRNEYLCLDTRSGEEAKFAESDLVLTDPSVTTSDRHHPSASVSVGDAPSPGPSGLGLRSGRQPVYRNFHENVPVGKSHFSVTLPKSYANIKLPSRDTLHRRFRFTELTATPGFFSQRALLLGADGDGTVEPAEAAPSLNFSLGYTCHDTLYFVQGEEGELEEAVFDQGNRASTLQVFVEDFNAHHERLIPPGFRRTPVFWDWVDLEWYRTRGQPDRLQQETHDSADQTVVFRPDPVAMVIGSDVVYYRVYSLDDPEALEPFAAKGLPLSARTLAGVNPYSLSTLFETQVEGLPLAANYTVRNVRLRLHVAPNTTVSFSSQAQLEALGFTAEQLGNRKKRYDFSNVGYGNEYLIFTGEAKPSFRLPALKAKVYCQPARSRIAHQFGNERVVFPAGVFAENARAYGAIQRAVEEAKLRAGLLFPRITYDPLSTKFQFLFPDNDSLNLFFVCDDRLAERMGFGPTNQITS